MLWLGQVWQKQVPVWLTWRRFVTAVVLIAGLSAIQLLPFFDLLQHSERSTSYDAANTSPMPLWGWANFVLPVFHCLHTAFGPWLQPPDQVWTSGYYCGLGTLALTTMAVWRRRGQIVVCGLAAFTLAGLVLALGDGGYIYNWLRHLIPWIGFARYPIKFVSLAVFALPLLAAFGLAHLQSAPPEGAKREERCWILSGVLWLAVLVLLLAAAWRLRSPYFSWSSAWRDGAVRALFLAGTVAAIAGLGRLPPLRVRGFVGLAVLALIGFDLVTSGLGANPMVVTKAFGPLELNMTSPPRFGESRAMVTQRVISYLDFAGTQNPLYYYVGLRGALFEDCNISEKVPKVDGFCSLYLHDEADINGIFYGAFLDKPRTNTPPAPLLDFLGVSQISATNTIFAWQERKTFLPLVTAGQRPIFASDADTMKELESTNFDPHRTVYLPLSARGEFAVTNASEARIIDQQFSAQQAQLTVEASAPALVVIAQSFYHDWHAYVDGKPVPLLRANHAFQALQVPPGQHEITLRYVDGMFRLGAVISALTLFGCLTGLFLKPRQISPDHPAQSARAITDL